MQPFVQGQTEGPSFPITSPSYDQVANNATEPGTRGSAHIRHDERVSASGGHHETGLHEPTGLHAGAAVLWNNQYAALAEHD